MNLEWIMIELQIMLVMVMFFNANIGNTFFENQRVSQKFETKWKSKLNVVSYKLRPNW
jgi:hypothetical protein